LLFRRCAFLLILGFGSTLHAQERKNLVGATIDLTAGGTNHLTGSVDLNQQTEPLFFFYGVYPSISFQSVGARSLFSSTYAFGTSRSQSDTKIHSNSHAATVSLSSPLSRSWKISGADAFERTDDVATFNAFRQVAPSPDTFQFIFDPVAARVVSSTNSATVTADYSISTQSSVSFTGSHAIRDYSGRGENAFLADQQRIAGRVRYNRHTSAVESWSLSYAPAYLSFKGFQDAHSHSGEVGYTRVIGRDLSFQLSVGTSYVQDTGSVDDYVGYNTSTSLQRTTQDNSFSLYYTQTTGEVSGLGSVSDTRVLGFSGSRKARNVTLFANISAFDTRGRLDNFYSTKAVQGAVAVGIPLAPTWHVQTGVQYQHYKQSSQFGLDQKRVFISLRYINPALFRFAK